MIPILHINSSFKKYNMYLNVNNKLFFKCYEFKPEDHEEEIRSSALECTKLLIEFAQNNGINSFTAEIKGPLRGILINELLKNGINIEYIMDITPIPHNGSFPKRKQLIKKI